MSRWADKAVEELETELEQGLISQEEFKEQMRDINAELRDEAFENAQKSYNNTMGW